MVFEIVLENFKEAQVAEKYGAKRIEVCSALDIGGVTPSKAIVKKCVEQCNLEVHAMIRPRGGGFVYDLHELEIMKSDITFFAEIGCRGVVFGILNADMTVDVANTKMLVTHAKAYGLETTFHRAIDFTSDIFLALEEIVSCGCDRILTSGKQSNVDTASKNLEALCIKAGKRIQIMAGGGVSQENIKSLLHIGLDAVHLNVRKLRPTDPFIAVGQEYDIDEDKVKKIRSIIFD